MVSIVQARKLAFAFHGADKHEQPHSDRIAFELSRMFMSLQQYSTKKGPKPF